ncbi:MAG: tetratricopeptide repeat protein, partial [Deltaproteobacteria bacterium]|nr:tetratricopeptide repeat protein [Deltaproteobacteria bacterium]
MMMHGAGDRGLLSLVWLVAIAFLFSTGCSHKSDHLSAGDQAMQHSQWDEAENEYQQAEKLNPSDVRPHLALVRVYLSKHEFQQAKSEAMRVVELEPKNPQGHAALADVYSASYQLG